MYSRDDLTYQALPLPDRVALPETEMLSRSEAFLGYMRKRHSVREFDTAAVAPKVIENCIETAGLAPSGANHQPWHFVAIRDPATKSAIRKAAEEEEIAFYDGGAGDEWLKALAPIGTGPEKPHLDDAPWLIVVFAQRYGEFADGTRYKNYYVPESVGIATGFLLTALHNAGLSALTHTPNPMKFLNDLLKRPASEKPVMIIATGYAAGNATVPAVAKIKKPLDEILTVV
ncbi:MAG: nitroreductase family protein [Nitratireductor sp.]|nr:nitroreductase family protein [Nitratireductor sp.]